MNWMNLGPIIQSEVSQKQKDKYHILMHVGEKAMAPHSSPLAWKIPWTEEPGGLQSMDGKELDMTEATQHIRTYRAYT